MRKPKPRLVFALLIAIGSEFLPVPGLLGAAMVFPQGIESDHGIAYLVLALCLNFAVFFGASYYIIGLLSRYVKD